MLFVSCFQQQLPNLRKALLSKQNECQKLSKKLDQVNQLLKANESKNDGIREEKYDVDSTVAELRNQKVEMGTRESTHKTKRGELEMLRDFVTVSLVW